VVEVEGRGTGPDRSPVEVGLQRVERAIRALPARFREVLVLRELEGLPYKEIADVIGVPIGTVMSRLSRARDRCRQLISAELADVRSGT